MSTQKQEPPAPACQTSPFEIPVAFEDSDSGAKGALASSAAATEALTRLQLMIAGRSLTAFFQEHPQIQSIRLDEDSAGDDEGRYRLETISHIEYADGTENDYAADMYGKVDGFEDGPTREDLRDKAESELFRLCQQLPLARAKLFKSSVDAKSSNKLAGEQACALQEAFAIEQATRKTENNDAKKPRI